MDGTVGECQSPSQKWYINCLGARHEENTKE